MRLSTELFFSSLSYTLFVLQEHSRQSITTLQTAEQEELTMTVVSGVGLKSGDACLLLDEAGDVLTGAKAFRKLGSQTIENRAVVDTSTTATCIHSPKYGRRAESSSSKKEDVDPVSNTRIAQSTRTKRRRMLESESQQWPQTGLLLALPCNIEVPNRCENGESDCDCRKCDGPAMCKQDEKVFPLKDSASHVCEQATQTYLSKRCVASSICEHSSNRFSCEDCMGPSNNCAHGIKQSQCKDCGRSGICEHGKQEYYCKDCGGLGICEHGKQKSYYKACDGAVGYLRAQQAKVLL